MHPLLAKKFAIVEPGRVNNAEWHFFSSQYIVVLLALPICPCMEGVISVSPIIKAPNKYLELDYGFHRTAVHFVRFIYLHGRKPLLVRTL